MSVFSFGDLPTIQTRKALILLDFQNDFVRPFGALHIPNTPDILETLPQLASAFRRVGDVVWVRSQYESPQTIVDWNFGDRIVLDRQPPRRKQSPTSDIIEVGSDRDSPEPVDPEAFLSADSSPCCDPSTPGYQFPAPILAAINPQHDTVVDKTGYSALESPGLVLSFRTHFVTELYLCGSLSNVSVFATALDAVRNGFSVTLVEDCLGFRDFQRHQEAMRRMADILGATGITAQELIQELDWDETEAIARQGAPQPKRSATAAGLESVMDSLEFWNTVDPSPTDDSQDPEEPSLSKLVTPSRAQRATAAAQARGPEEGQKKVRARIRRPKRRDAIPAERKSAECQTKIGEGDSRLVTNVKLAADSFERIQAEVDWQKMYHMSGQVPRLVAVQGQTRPDGAIAIYRHPADESPPFKPFTSTVDEVRMAVEQILGHPLNHVLIQLYRDGQDRISEHSDKTLDITRESFICNVSLGAERVMVLRTKASASEPEAGVEPRRTAQRVPLPHNSLFVLGPKTNMRWLHGIRADKRPSATKSTEEQAYGGQRISLTFRHIGTFIDPVANTIWGQGAVSKTLEQARAVVHGDPAEAARLITAFGQENRATEFDWDAVYGGGFDVVNFVTTSTGQLLLGCDLVANLRVRLCLGENGVRYRLTTNHEQGLAQLEGYPIYETPDGTTVAGDSVILAYMANRSAEASCPGVDSLLGGNFLSTIDEFLTYWRQHRATNSASRFEYGIEDWDRTLQGQHYLGGSVFTIDDCSLWPVLRDIVQTQGTFDARFTSLNQYYHRVENRGIVRSILEE
ncbi:Oxoglutarate/iron-dependent dioxygenase [Penicillium robsamsonii]|uniref:Oxoglutarate/iron-dependent dioxygenase n=1 Tax=Penicillium robsamsonii TaxID=1792511 RepID=UPI002547D114|nr:Oxoglutarate/iron-dependent dioxygenase [Penicillium robsamsonii]KAJ5815805.1 Oxoglutarate/iron-dependent dioxygenase [Penicillium robsamsonii]